MGDLSSLRVESETWRLQSILDQPFTIQAAWLWLSLLATLLFLEILFARKLRARWPPGPPALPILGCLLYLRKDIPTHRNYANLAKKYGSFMYFPIGMQPTIVFTGAEMIKTVLKEMDRIWSSRPPTLIGGIMGFDNKSIIFTEMGDHHRRLKRLFQNVLFSPQSVASSGKLRERAVSQGVLSILDSQDQISENSQKTLNLTKIMGTVVTNTLVMVTMGDGIDQEKVDELKGIIRTAMRLVSTSTLCDFIPFLRFFPNTVRLARSMTEARDNERRFFKIIIDQARQRRAAGREKGASEDDDDINSRSLLHVLLSLEGEEKPTDDEITIWILDSIIPGTETSLSATDWTLAELLQNPDVVKRLVEELDTVVGRDRMVRTSDIPRLPFLHAIVKESLRLHPTTPMALPHKSMEACEIQGYKIPAGTTALVNLWALGRDAKYWEDPHTFNPDRFMNSATDVLGQSFEVLPFSSGRRGCVGKLVGLAVVYLNVATMVHCFNWTVEGDDVDMTEKLGLGCPRANPLFCSATPRLPPVVYEALRSTA